MPTQELGATLRGTILGALLLAASGCAPDAWNPSSGFDGWIDHIGRACYPNRIGLALVDEQLRWNAGFLDMTSRLYFKKMSFDAYASAVNSAFYGNNAGALDCIRDNLPK